MRRGIKQGESERAAEPFQLKPRESRKRKRVPVYMSV